MLQSGDQNASGAQGFLLQSARRRLALMRIAVAIACDYRPVAREPHLVGSNRRVGVRGFRPNATFTGGSAGNPRVGLWGMTP